MLRSLTIAVLLTAGCLAVWQWQTGEPERILCDLGVPEMGILTCAQPVVEACPATLPRTMKTKAIPTRQPKVKNAKRQPPKEALPGWMPPL